MSRDLPTKNKPFPRKREGLSNLMLSQMHTSTSGILIKKGREFDQQPFWRDGKHDLYLFFDKSSL